MKLASSDVFPGAAPRRSYVGLSVSLCLAAAALVVLWLQLKELDFHQVAALILQTSVWQWAMAAGATAISFAALAQYDAFWHRFLGTGVSEKHAKRTGFAAIAVGQTVGLCSVTSGFVRWRCLPQLAPTLIMRLSAAVSLSFMIVWGLCALVAAWLLVAPLAGFSINGVTVIAAASFAALAAWTAVNRSKLTFAQLSRLAVLVVIDIAAAATVVWVLLPSGIDLPWTTLVAGFTLALGAGLVANSPGGIGPFELVLLTALPALPAEALISAILGYRLIYFVIPFLLALPIVIAGAGTPMPKVSGPADWTLAHQSGRLRRYKDSWAHVIRPLPGLSIALGDPEPAPLGHRSEHLLPRGLTGIYKSSPARAAQARAHGFTVSLLAQEAVLDPTQWTPEGPEKKRLRQALRKAEKLGICVQHSVDLPLQKMAQIANEWARIHGGELGASMGRFEPSYVQRQTVFLIYEGSNLVGFVTFNTARDWSLDLIRHVANIPEGAIHAAVVAAIRSAADIGINRLSLGAVPAQTGVLARWSESKTGLTLFKRRFAPRWEPRYLITRHRVSHLIAGIALAFAIQRPLPRLRDRVMWRLHDYLAGFEFASSSRARDTGADVEAKDTECQPLPTR